MHHVAIMNKKLGLLPKITSGEKQIESRWYNQRHCPWNQVSPGDTIFFKNAGDSITVETKVGRVEQYENLTPGEATKLVKNFHKALGLNDNQIEEFLKLNINKKYCILMYLEEPKLLEATFSIDKAGYGNMSAWLVIDDINNIKIH